MRSNVRGVSWHRKSEGVMTDNYKKYSVGSVGFKFGITGLVHHLTIATEILAIIGWR